jgi:transcriptional regulator of acetoin/glycerol metabolism
MQALERYDWPGNVRELKNALAYAQTIGDGPVLELTDLPSEIVDAEAVPRPLTAPPDDTPRAEQAGADPEARRILRALERSGGHRERAAKLLGISRITLWRRLKRLGLE